MNKPQLIVAWVMGILLLSGCGFSLSESYIRSKRPNSFKCHKVGPISPLSDKDICEAIAFGKVNRHKGDVIDYAFMSKGTVFPGTHYVYILVQTNYYLISKYAAEISRNYEQIDMDYVNFLSTLPTMRIKVFNQVSPVGAGIYAYQTEAKFVLLKEGIKMKESDVNPLYQNQSPYFAPYLTGIQWNWQETANAITKQTMEVAKQITEAYQKDLKINLDNIPTLAIDRPSNLYNYNDIDTNARYEVVVIYEDGEKRIPIDFSKIK